MKDTYEQFDNIVICDGPVDIKSYGLCMGVIFNKILKDIYAKFFQSSGFQISYDVSWDIYNSYFDELIEKFGSEEAEYIVRKQLKEHMTVFYNLNIACKNEYSTANDMKVDQYIEKVIFKIKDTFKSEEGEEGSININLDIPAGSENYVCITGKRINARHRTAQYCPLCHRFYSEKSKECLCGRDLIDVNYCFTPLFESCCMVVEQMEKDEGTINLIIEGRRETDLIMPYVMRLAYTNTKIKTLPHGNMLSEQKCTVTIIGEDEVCISTLRDYYRTDIVRLWCIMQCNKENIVVSSETLNKAKQEYYYIQDQLGRLIERFGYPPNGNTILQNLKEHICKEGNLWEAYVLMKIEVEALINEKDLKNTKEKWCSVIQGMGVILPNLIRRLRRENK